MLNLPNVNHITKNISSIDTFLGLNKGFKIGENELADSYNMCSDDYPALSTRRKRKIFKESEESNGVFQHVGGIASVAVTNETLAFLSRQGTLYYDDQTIDLDIKDNRLLRTGNMLYAYPSGTLIKLPNKKEGELTTEITHTKLQFVAPGEDSSATGIIDEKGTLIGYVFFLPALSSAIGRTNYIGAPQDLKVGDCWYSNFDGSEYSLKMWADTGSGEMGWVSVEPDCIRVSTLFTTKDKEISLDTSWFKNIFKVGDVVFFSNTKNENLDGSFIVEAFGDADDPAMYLSGYLTTDYAATDCVIEKKMPEKLDFVIEHNNRLWGCFYGYDSEGNFYNEIYATAQNDPTNWYRYDGTSMQSYTMSVVSDGKFTGAAVINGYVTFFKENCMHRIYGTSPTDFQIVTYECAGIQEGCEGSFAGYNGTYFYKSNIGVMQISDGYPVRISEKIGHDNYTEAVGGTDGSYYYVQMKNEDEVMLYVYDIAKGIWHCESAVENLHMFFNYRNNLFAVSEKITEESKEKYEVCICSFSKSSSLNIALPDISMTGNISLYDEEDFQWYFETGNIGYSYYLTKHIDKLCVRAMVDSYARFNVEILHDSEGEWAPVATIIGDSSVKTHLVPIRPKQCDHFKLRFSGIGDAKILNMIMQYAEGGDFT